MRMGATTHAMDGDMRAVELTHSVKGARLTARLPRGGDGRILPPGPYYAFAMRETPEGPVPPAPPVAPDLRDDGKRWPGFGDRSSLEARLMEREAVRTGLTQLASAQVAFRFAPIEAAAEAGDADTVVRLLGEGSRTSRGPMPCVLATRSNTNLRVTTRPLLR